MEKGTAEERTRVIELFKRYFYKRMHEDRAFFNAVQALRGKVLGCWCKPLPCHGDVIKAFLDCGMPYARCLPGEYSNDHEECPVDEHHPCVEHPHTWKAIEAKVASRMTESKS